MGLIAFWESIQKENDTNFQDQEIINTTRGVNENMAKEHYVKRINKVWYECKCDTPYTNHQIFMFHEPPITRRQGDYKVGGLL